MKVYSISSPEQMERAADLVKWERDRKKVIDFIERWKRESRDGQQENVTLEVGRNAIIFYIHPEGKKTQLATLYVIPAREFAREELTEI